jgi:tRNA (cmo5U34)-methyltransferase
MTDKMEIPTDWTFKNKSVASHFDQHVREQLPWYDLVSGAVAHIAQHFIPENGRVYDIGCSTGNISRLLAEPMKVRNASCIGLDNSANMVAQWNGYGEVHVAEATTYDYQPHDLSILFLCLMFIPIQQRRTLIHKLVETSRPGGAIIVVDKTEAPNGYLGTILHRLTIAGKVATGTSTDDIINKELSLSGVQRPLHPNTLPTSFHQFFRFGEFAGWIHETPL